MAESCQIRKDQSMAVYNEISLMAVTVKEQRVIYSQNEGFHNN